MSQQPHIEGVTGLEPVAHGRLIERFRATTVDDDDPVVVEVLTDAAAHARPIIDDHEHLESPRSVATAADGEVVVIWPGGETLARRLDDLGPMPWHRAASGVAALADAVAHLHGRGLCHGTVSTSTVRMGRRGPVLTGVGLAQLRSIAEGEPDPVTVCPLAFAAPELAVADAPTEAGDIYGLGALLAVMVDDADDPDVFPPRLRAVVDQATATPPEMRQPGARALAADLRAAVASSFDDESDEVARRPDEQRVAGDSTGDQADDETWVASLDLIIDPVSSGNPQAPDGDGAPDDGRAVTLAELERRGAPIAPTGLRSRWDDDRARPTIEAADEPDGDADQFDLSAPYPPVPNDGAVLIVTQGRHEIEEPLDGDARVTGGQLIVRAEIRGSLIIEGGRAVVLAPIRDDVTNNGGTVIIEAPVGGEIRGQPDFTIQSRSG